jgi:hypothetical protein
LQYIVKTNTTQQYSHNLTTQQYWSGSGNIIVVPMSA